MARSPIRPRGPSFFDVAKHPTASFTADLVAGPAGLEAQGTLDLHGQSAPLTLPFTLEIQGDVARMTGTAQTDRRDFGLGAGYGDEATVGFWRRDQGNAGGQAPLILLVSLRLLVATPR